MKSNHRLSFMKSFCLSFLPIMLLFSIIAIIFFFQELKSKDLLLKSKERQHSETLLRLANDSVKTVLSDLFMLSVNPELYKLIQNDVPQTRQALAATFKKVSTTTKRYDQIRFVDDSGMEVVRINFTEDRATIVANNKLQNKAKRYYFQDTLQLEPGQLFISPFDLNIEQGQIERPLKPMIRFGTPVADLNGRKHGIILLNYFGNRLIDSLNQASVNSAGEFMLFNPGGYWIKGLTSDDEWGFMFKDRKHLTLTNRDPESWATISSSEDGQFSNDQGLFTFTTFRPLSRNRLGITQPEETNNTQSVLFPANGHYFKIVSLVTKRTLNDYKTELFYKWLPFYLLTALLLGGFAWGASIALVQRRQAARDQLYREKLQAVLEMAGAVCHELNQPMQVIMGCCDLLLMEVEKEDVVYEKIKKIEKQIERMGSITLKLSKITKYETIDYLEDKIIDIEKSAL